MLPQRLDKTLLVGTSAVFFLIVNYVKLVPYAYLGQLNLGNLAAALVFAPLAPLGVWLGVWLHARISDRAFLPGQLRAAVPYGRQADLRRFRDVIATTVPPRVARWAARATMPASH
jgi:hypothetical protein